MQVESEPPLRSAPPFTKLLIIFLQEALRTGCLLRSGKISERTVPLMTARQKKFAEYYAQSGNTVQSAIKAGYSEKYAKADACKILDNPSVAEYIRELSEKAQDERIMTAKERQALLSDIAKDGKNDPADRIRAVDTLNKMTGEYVAKIQAEVKTSEKLSDVFAQIGGEGLNE